MNPRPALVLWPLLALLTSVYVQKCAAEAGYFNRPMAWTIVALFAATALSLTWYFIALMRDLLRPLSRPRLRLSLSLVCCLAPLAVYLTTCFIPSERVTGNNDQGTYTLQAINLCRTGSIFLHPQALENTDPAFRELLIEQRPTQAQRGVDHQQLRDFYLGFFVRQEHPAELESQFPPGYPLLLADAYSTFGWKGMQCVNLSLLVISALLCGILALRWFGIVPALTAFAAFLLFPLHVWLGNTFFAEAAVMLPWLLLLYALDQLPEANDLTAHGWAAITGLCVSLILTVKIDGLPAVIALGVPLLDAMRKPISVRRVCVRLAVMLPAAYSCLEILRHSGSYNAETIASLVRTLGRFPLILAILMVAALGLTALAFLIQRYRKRSTQTGGQLPAAALAPKPAGRLARWDLLFRIVIACAILSGLIYFYFFRPASVGTDRFFYWPLGREIRSLREVTLLRLGWYFSPALLWIALLGMLAFVCQARKPPQMLILLLGISTLLLFAHDLHNNPIQPYGMRRFLTYASPCLVFGIAMAVALVLRIPRVGKPVGISLALAAIVPLLQIDDRMNRSSDCVGLYAQLQELADLIPPNAIVLASSDGPTAELTGPLQFIYGKTVILVKRNAFLGSRSESLRRELCRLQENGRPICFLSTTPRSLDRMTYREQPESHRSGEIVVTSLEQTTTSKPFSSETRRWAYHLRRIVVSSTRQQVRFRRLARRHQPGPIVINRDGSRVPADLLRATDGTRLATNVRYPTPGEIYYANRPHADDN